MTDALIFAGTIRAFFTVVNCFFDWKAAAGFSLLHFCYEKLAALCTGIGISLFVISHIFQAADIGLIFPGFSLLMIGKLYEQGQLFVGLTIFVILFTFIAGIYNNPVNIVIFL